MVELIAAESMPALRDSTDPDSARVTIRPRAGGVPADLGAPVLPGSKSHAQRALILAGLGTGSTTLENVPDSVDVHVLGAAIEALGARVERDGATWCVHAAEHLREAHIDCRDNGTALRMLMMLVGLLGGRAWFDGSGRLRQRPISEACSALEGLGMRISSDWPLHVDGRGADRWSQVEVSVRDTSQITSGALLAIACRRLRGVVHPGTIFVPAPVAAATSYWDVTAAVLRAFGLTSQMQRVSEPRDGLRASIGPLPLDPTWRYVVPPDASAATFVAALAAMHGCALPAWPDGDGHPDWLALGEITRLVATPSPELWCAHGLAMHPDSFPALCAVAAMRAGPAQLRGAPALRHKESDRVAAMATGLRALGVACQEHDDGLVIVGRDLRRSPATAPVLVPSADDHRVVMALSLLGTVVPGGVTVDHRAAVAKSWPKFFDWLGRVAEVG